jgi:FKBP-type peptidyl-prolyl cis-trans isomerase 2
MENNEVKKEEHTEHAGHSETKPAEHHVEHHPEHHSTLVSSPKKTNWKTILFAVIAIILLVIIILMLTNVINMKGTSQAKITTKELLNLTYEVYSDGALIGSENILAEKDSLSDTLGLLTTKLDTEINKMSTGEEKNITLAPEDAYGDYNSKLTFAYPRVNKQDRTNIINRTAWIAITSFTSTFNEQPIINKVYNLSSMPWPYKVLEVNATHARISQEPTLNQEIPYGMFTLKVTGITDNKITLTIQGEDTIIPTSDGDYMVNFTDTQIITTLMAKVGQELSLTDPDTGELLPVATVLSLNDTHLVLDGNPQYAGKTIIVQVKLIEKKTEKSTVTGSTIKHIEGAPTMQVFIMSHCPYGTQIVKGLLPVWEKFQSKANIELRFVSYTMHGAQEDLDNNRILCIREEQSPKLPAYLNCFVYGDGSETSSQACITSTGIDKTKLDSCLKDNAATYMKVDTDLNTQYGVQGSPTIILDGKEASVYPRDPASVAKALCDAFSSKPSECSFSFDTTNPSPGFGGGTASSSGSAASCG